MPRRSYNTSNSNDISSLTEEEIEEIHEAFNLFDTENSGTVDPKEIKCAMQSLGLDTKNPLVFQIISDIEKSGSSSINFNDFLQFITSRLGNRNSKEGIQKIFNLFDDDKTGSISFKNIKRVAKELGENISDQELRDMINKADSNGDGELSFDDFYNIMTRKVFS
ncbi:Caltractin ICL1c [Babesia microti strain RI]|uniref:Caltractin ICL1c n=1 Tax=Babesia microti (strain RI) TaxID=1133968 RepID=I7IH68_BABMR|nr:Caltractin ICL1c [Babesia microti strain RI]CCF75287.1 Caltractin ICL1c [Babesia microti strain RI]|eukprot:XP_012649695.1 Caltractin ICL1c [Babesia microti strain RI]